VGHGGVVNAAVKPVSSFLTIRDPDRWLRQHHEEYAHALPGSAPRQLPPPRDQQAARETDLHHHPGPQSLALEVPHLAAQSTTAEGLTGVCARPEVTPLCRPRGAQRRGGNGERVRRWFQEKKAGWYAVLAGPQMPVTSTLLDQAHNAIERKLFAMKGFHHPTGSQQAFLTGLAHLYNLVPYQRRAKHAGQCGVEVEGGRVPTPDWMLNLQILTSGGFR
jgi:hypothetical protein